MDSELDPFLKDIFAELAQVGIGLPHRGHEVPLMEAGKKPCLIAEWPFHKGVEDFTTLDPLIATGQLVLIGTDDFVCSTHIICRPEDVKAAQKEAIIKGKMYAGETIDRAEFESHEAFLDTYSGIKVRNEDGIYDPRELNRRSSRAEDDYELLLNGTIKATLPIITGTDFQACPPNIMKHFADGTLCAVHVNTETFTNAIIAQKDCVAMGQELYARYWHNDKGYEPLKGADLAKRIGHLLGYTPADTDYFLTIRKPPSEQTSVEKDAYRLFEESFDMLRHARAQHMLFGDPTP